MRVLCVSTSDVSGGAARAAFRIHLAVRDRGVDSVLFVKEKGSECPDVIPLSDFIPHNLFCRVFDWLHNKIKNKIQHYIWGKYPNREGYLSDTRATDIHGALRKLDYDILHLHWVNQRFLPLKQLPKDKPIVWTLHDTWPFCGVCHYFDDCKGYCSSCGFCPQLRSNKAKDLSRFIWQRKKRYYKHLRLQIVAPSHWMAYCAGQSGLLAHFPISVIPNCIDPAVYRPLAESEISERWASFLPIRGKKRYILYGAMNATSDKRKGYSFLVSALIQMNRVLVDNQLELIVFGAEQYMEDISITAPVHYVGYVSDIEELVSLYSLADVMVVPSLNENLSCAIMESLACGTPVVAFNVGGNADMIDHKRNGYLAIEKDSGDLADGILWCLESNCDGHLSASARQKVLLNFVPGVVGKKYAELYESLIK